MAPLIDEDGHEINPHMPQYISNVPFYINPNQKPSLSHQRISSSPGLSTIPISEFFQRGLSLTPSAKFRANSCANCGAMTHNVKTCFERPRKN